MAKREWLLNHGYKEYSVNGKYYKVVNDDFINIIELNTDKYYLIYDEEAFRVEIYQKDIDELTKMMDELKTDHETMIKECE